MIKDKTLQEFSTVDSNSITREILNWKSMVKTSEILSCETDVSELKKKIMQVVIENTGAQRGLLILNRDGEFFIEIEKSVNKPETFYEDSLNIEEINDDKPLLAMSIVRLVIRMSKEMIVDEPAMDSKFNLDPYFSSSKPGSILCWPILLQSRLLGVIYLENFSLTGAFSKVHLEVINVLSLQAAISLENLRLQENLNIASDVFKRVLQNKELKIDLPHPKTYLTIKEEINHYLVPYKEVLYISAENYYCNVISKNKKYKYIKQMKELEKELPEEKFIRVHRGYIVNIDFVDYIQYFMAGTFVVYLKSKEQIQIPIGRSYTQIVKKKLGLE